MHEDSLQVEVHLSLLIQIAIQNRWKNFQALNPLWDLVPKVGTWALTYLLCQMRIYDHFMVAKIANINAL